MPEVLNARPGMYSQEPAPKFEWFPHSLASSHSRSTAVGAVRSTTIDKAACRCRCALKRRRWRCHRPATAQAVQHQHPFQHPFLFNITSAHVPRSEADSGRPIGQPLIQMASSTTMTTISTAPPPPPPTTMASSVSSQAADVVTSRASQHFSSMASTLVSARQTYGSGLSFLS